MTNNTKNLMTAVNNFFTTRKESPAIDVRITVSDGMKVHVEATVDPVKIVTTAVAARTIGSWLRGKK